MANIDKAKESADFVLNRYLLKIKAILKKKQSAFLSGNFQTDPTYSCNNVVRYTTMNSTKINEIRKTTQFDYRIY